MDAMGWIVAIALIVAFEVLAVMAGAESRPGFPRRGAASRAPDGEQRNWW
jgi:hypothetical protein